MMPATFDERHYVLPDESGALAFDLSWHLTMGNDPVLLKQGEEITMVIRPPRKK